MRIVFLIDNYKRIGGGGYAQYNFAKHLAEEGHNVIVFAGDKNFFSNSLKTDKLLIKYRRSIPELKKIGIGKRRTNTIWIHIHKKLVIEPFLKEFKPDWIVGYMRISAIKAVELGQKFKIPVANFVFETPPWIERTIGIRWTRSLRASWEKARQAYGESDVLIPNSALSGVELAAWLPGVRVSEPVYPGVDAPAYTQKKIHQRKYDLIYIGRLTKHKNVDLLLRSADPKHKIVIIGTGEESEKLKMIAKENELSVKFTGNVSDSEKWALLGDSKLMVFPSSFEGFGMPPLEALACGCRVLCSDIPILKEVYSGEVNYFSLNQPNTLRDQIVRLLNERKPIVRSYLLDKYTWKASALKIESILKNN